jgi:uncharacterized membrane protein
MNPIRRRRFVLSCGSYKANNCWTLRTVVAVKDESGKIKLHHEGNLISDTAVFQGFCGSLANLILLNAAAGAAPGALTDVGINDHFMRELTATLIPSVVSKN